MSRFQVLSKEASEKLVAEQVAKGRLNFSIGNSKLKKTSKRIKAILEGKGDLNGFVPRGYRVVSFNTPAGGYKYKGVEYLTCPFAGRCLPIYYARSGPYRWDSAKIPRIANHQILMNVERHGRKQDRWTFNSISEGLEAVVSLLLDSIDNLPKSVGVIRIHDSGDFFSYWYMQAWFMVAAARPDILFYAYTKSINLLKVARKNLSQPENLRITQSFGGKQDHLIDPDLPHSLIFTGHGATKDEQEANAHKQRIALGYPDGNDEIEGDLLAISGAPRIGLVYHGTAKLTDAQVNAFQPQPST